MTTFCTKFFAAECKLGLSDLSSTTQREDESLIAYVNRFKEVALDYKEIISEEELIRVCINRMQAEYKVPIENHMSSYFAELMFGVSNTKATVAKMRKAMPDKRIATENWNIPPFSKRRKEVATVDKC